MKRVVVTGVGAVTPLGIGAETFWEGLTAGRSGIRRIEAWDPSDLEVQIGGEVRGFEAKDFMDFKAARRMDRFAQFAVAAGREALDHAGLEITDDNREMVGVVVNTGGGGIPTIENEVGLMHTKGPKRVSPFLIPLFAPNMASCQVSIAFGIRGPSSTSAAACASGVQAFVDAVHMIRRGEVDVALTGGTEAGITPVAVAGLGNMGALSRRNDDPAGASRPFDLGRDGFVFSEGAAIMVLESEEHAVRRGASVICEVAGGAYTSDAFHITAPDPSGSGAALAMKRALKWAELEPTAVDYVAAHATATPLGDIAETEALKQALGDHAYKVAISANKSMLGHLLGAAGAVSSLACVLAIRDNLVPPTINLTDPDPKCDLDYVPNTARQLPVNVAMANGFGFGGQNACAVFRRFTG
ncbi:MAG: 3-oxoacyl-[acyl-carrier-protein] synthase [Thermomicrobiales bacterium]|nr:3-oxoacyl-[acyl-carrier-protein] synthase [Thermomicrobiales bacterium]